MTTMEQIFKAVLDQDSAPVVLCGLDHTVLYMNAAAIQRYNADGGADLIGRSVMVCHPPYAQKAIERVLAWFQESPEHNTVYTFRNDRENKDVYMIALRADDGSLIGYYEKHAYRSRETMRLYEMP